MVEAFDLGLAPPREREPCLTERNPQGRAHPAGAGFRPQPVMLNSWPPERHGGETVLRVERVLPHARRHRPVRLAKITSARAKVRARVHDLLDLRPGGFPWVHMDSRPLIEARPNPTRRSRPTARTNAV
ncbi:hypothetical protein Scel_25710 [Streptomyces cellostaticus]|nr:hypothetical protein Scel_25710 [Streptomyces cellostaticus]